MVIDNPNLLAQFYASLGDAYHAQEEIPESDDAYDKSLDIMPDNTYVLNNYSYYLSLRKKKLEKASDMMKRCVELSPGQASYEDTYAWVLYQLKDYNTALIWIEKALASGGISSATIVEHYGDILYRLKRTIEALEQWQKAKELGSDSENLDQKIADKKLYE
jgi:Tfp pilus assembly protein PilF